MSPYPRVGRVPGETVDTLGPVNVAGTTGMRGEAVGSRGAPGVVFSHPHLVSRIARDVTQLLGEDEILRHQAADVPIKRVRRLD